MLSILYLALDVDLTRARGESIHVRGITEALAASGHRIHLVVAKAPSGTTPDGIETSERPEGSDLDVLRHVLGIVRRVHPNAIYERRSSPKISAAAFLLSGIPFLVEFNGLPEEEVAMQGRSLPGGAVGAMKSIVRFRLIRSAAGVVAVTPGLGTAIADRYGVDPARIHIVGNGVDSALFRPMARETARADLGLGGGTVVCFVGNLVRWQGIDTLVEAIPMTAGDTSFLIVGDGPDRLQIESRANDLGVAPRVRFVGTVAHQLVPRYIAAADVCVAPFTSERNLSSGVSALKIYEYIACARPVIASDIPGAADLISEYGCGATVPPDDPASLASAINAVVRNPVFAERAHRASALVRETHSWAHRAAVLARTIGTAIRAPPPTATDP